MSKYIIPVHIQTSASTVIGEVECDSLADFNVKAEELWESKGYDYPSTNIHNDFDLCDWELSEMSEDDLIYYEVV
jgi:hypothetical protein|tara:strand:- start:92 stop:316 length:225 start_codon:yes stop_codon:yes gene_type:complete